MKKMNRKGFTLVELLAVIVILAILMAIAATNIGPVIDNSRRSSMRTTAQSIMEAVRLQLTSNYALYEGKYTFTTGIVESGGVSAPFGGYYAYGKTSSGTRVANSSVYTVSLTANSSSAAECNESPYSYVIIKRTEETYKWSICLTTSSSATGQATKDNQPGGYLYATREELDNKDNTNIFYGKAKLAK